MRVKFSILLIFSALFTYSQSGFNSEGMQVTRGDLEQNTYSKDTTARALVIYEKGNSFVDKNSFKLNTEITQKLKIFNRTGFDKATEEIYLYKSDNGSKEKVKNIKATVYNIEDGDVKTVKLSTENIIEEVYNERYDIVKFTFPNIKEGSVINYSYVIESPFMFNYKTWRFQDDIPKLYSEYNASIPGNWEYHIKLVGEQKLVINDVKSVINCLDGGNGAYASCSNYRYAMKDVPAFIVEDYMTTTQNYLSRIEYELKTFRSFDGTKEHYTKSWKNTDNEIKKGTDFGNQLKKLNITRDLLDQSITEEQNTLEKSQLIYNYVQENYAWNESFRLFEDVSLKTLLKEKSGNASEINILLHNLLKDNDINVKPLLISTRNNGFITKLFPNISEFNYMIVSAEIEGKTYLLDATDDFLSFGQIPFRCLNSYGRLIDLKNESTWYDINVDKTSIINYRGELDIDSEGNIAGHFNLKANGYHALSRKKRYLNNNEGFIENLSNTYNSIDFKAFSISTLSKTDPEFNAKINIEKKSDIIGDIIYLNPFLFSFFTENPFKLQERSYPVDFGYKDSYSYMLKLNIDSSYTIKEVPKELNLALPNNSGSVTSNYMVNDNTIIVIFKLTFNESIYNASYYVYLKKLMDSAINIQKNSIIVLEKKE
ncbi:DUF3857 domain-containing protein [Psychroserpens sp.]